MKRINIQVTEEELIKIDNVLAQVSESIGCRVSRQGFAKGLMMEALEKRQNGSIVK